MRTISILALCLVASGARAEPITAPEGWVAIDTDKPFARLLDDLTAAVSANGFGVVTQAGPTAAAKQRGVDIPDNRIVGVFNNIYAVRVLALSVPAMIEAPVRFYLTDDGDGTASLSWKTPSHVFAPYMSGAIPDLAVAAGELDAVFQAIADTATQ